MPDIALGAEHVMENKIETPLNHPHHWKLFVAYIFGKFGKKYLEIDNYNTM